MMSLQVFTFALFVLAPICSGHIGGAQSPDLSPKFYCGRALARMIANICFDVAPENAKRSDAGTMYGSLISPYYKEQEKDMGWPWLSSSKAMTLGSNRGKRLMSGGIADECCEKPCSINELVYYC